MVQLLPTLFFRSKKSSPSSSSPPPLQHSSSSSTPTPTRHSAPPPPRSHPPSYPPHPPPYSSSSPPVPPPKPTPPKKKNSPPRHPPLAASPATATTPSSPSYTHLRSASTPTAPPVDRFQHWTNPPPYQKPKKSLTRRKRRDPDLHPLNLPPDELRRLSAMASSGARSSMDVDPQTPSTDTNGVNQNRSPTPPPHRSNGDTPEADSFKLAGNKFFKDGNYSRAIEEFSKALEINPSSAVYLSNRAAAYMSAHKYSNALADCERARELDPANSKILYRLARILTSLGRPAEALEVLNRIEPPASATDKATAEKMLRFVTQAQETLREDRGVSMVLFCLDQARQLLGSGVREPRAWSLLAAEGQLKLANDNSLGKAQDIAINLLRDNSQDPDAMMIRARAFYAMGDTDQALKVLKMVLGLDPDMKQAIRLLRSVQKLKRTKEAGNDAFKARDYRGAIDRWSEALAVDPSNKDMNAKILQNRAQAHIYLKAYDEAVADCTEALRLEPGYIKAQKVRAKAHGGAGNWEEAARDYKAVAEANPTEKGIQEDIRRAEFELKKAQRKDYYKIMGLEKDASDHEIKKAYRKLAIKYHPDKNQNDQKCDEKFKEIGEAYETLIDPQKRAAYDNGDDLMDPADMFSGGGMGGMGGFGGGFGGMGGMGGGTSVNIDPSVLFNMMNGGGGFAQAGGQRGGFGGFPF